MNKHDFEIYLRNSMREITKRWQEAYPGDKFLNVGVLMEKDGDSWFIDAFNDTEARENERFDYRWREDVETVGR